MAYVGFVAVGFILILVGAALKWAWILNRRIRYLHLGAIALVAAEALVGLICPITLLENWLLIGSGQAGRERTFIGQLLYNLLYYDFPSWIFSVAYIALTILAILLLIVIPPKARSKAI
ncbi:MAG: DUF2784 domain-containing protein [Candidatus Marinimicrobia bacterium]|nr:DUF2784 domain-containing protein [Candidatus Neomarinimicrobiota bacterium]